MSKKILVTQNFTKLSQKDNDSFNNSITKSQGTKVSRRHSFIKSSQNILGTKRTYSNYKKIGENFLQKLSEDQRTRLIDPKTEINENLWQKPHIQKRLEKFTKFLENLKYRNNFSLQEYLFDFTETNLPKYNGLNDFNVEKVWDLLKDELEVVTKDIEQIFKELRKEEMKIKYISRVHENQIKIRKEIYAKIAEKISEKALEDDFKLKQREVAQVLRKMEKLMESINCKPYPREMVSNARMKKYEKDWKKNEHLEIRDFRRKRNRIKMNKILMDPKSKRRLIHLQSHRRSSYKANTFLTVLDHL